MTMAAATIREASRADIPLIRRLAGEAFPATYGTILTPEQIDYMMEWMYSAASLLAQFDGGQRFFIAASGDEPCGYLSIERQGKRLFHLQKIYLLPGFQGRGLGRMLFLHAADTVRSMAHGPCRMQLNVNRYNPALRFYERMGMVRVGEGDFPIGAGYFMNDFIMELRIG